MLLYTTLYIVLAYLMLFAALTNSVCLNNASFFFHFKYFLCQGYELSGEIALKNNHYYLLLLLTTVNVDQFYLIKVKAILFFRVLIVINIHYSFRWNIIIKKTTF